MPARRQPTWAAIDRDALPIAGGVFARGRSMLKGETDVIRNEKIEMTVPVVVQKRATGSPPRRGGIPQSGLLRHIRKGAVAIVAIEAVLPEVGTKDVVKAIV